MASRIKTYKLANVVKVRNPVARDLRDRRFGKRIVPNKKHYSYMEKHIEKEY